ncbi:MAG TPA: hypothetical protein VGE01_08765 [Fimbriimonas sp.]
MDGSGNDALQRTSTITVPTSVPPRPSETVYEVVDGLIQNVWFLPPEGDGTVKTAVRDLRAFAVRRSLRSDGS